MTKPAGAKVWVCACVCVRVCVCVWVCAYGLGLGLFMHVQTGNRVTKIICRVKCLKERRYTHTHTHTIQNDIGNKKIS